MTEQPPGEHPGGAPGQVRQLAERRTAARRARDYAAADELRDKIAELGWLITDTATGYALAPAAGGAASGGAVGGSLATVGLLVEGWPDDLRECVGALLQYAPAGVVISGLDVGNRDGAGDVLDALAAEYPGRIEVRHVASDVGWSAGRNALLRADQAPVHVIMETSTILTGDAISPLLTALAADGVVAAGWRGTDPDPDLRGFHDAGPGPVTALLGYLLAVRAEAAAVAGGLPPKARFYRNADLEFSLRLGNLGRLVVPDEPLPVRQARHRGYHDSDPDYRERESRRNYRRVLDLLRARAGGETAGGG